MNPNDVTGDFEIAITRQGWLNGVEVATGDLCSHGDVRLVIGGLEIFRGAAPQVRSTPRS